MKKIAKTLNIIEEKNDIDDHLLDIIGNEFKFDHQKGLAEWIKNSADAYIRAGTPEKDQVIILNFSDKGEKTVIECVDFIGMTIKDIIKSFKRWGDPEAARRGTKRKVYGGHGNGGKFYMRQMFEQSYFITYSSTSFNIFGFSPNKKYGFAEEYKEISISPHEALTFANLMNLPIPNFLKEKVISQKTGFTVVKGIRPQGMPKKLQVHNICEKLKNHPQARRLLEKMHIMVIYNQELFSKRLIPDKLKPKQGFEEPWVFDIPEELKYLEKGERHVVKMATSKFNHGRLILKTSEEALERAGRLGDLNRIDVVGEVGSIASYPLHEISFGMYPQSVFIYGEVECPILEDPEDDCVKNDRSKLIAENPKVKALLEWMGNKINEVAEKIAKKERKEQEELIKEQSKAYNEFLNKWSSKFLNKIKSEIFIGPGEGPGFGSGTGGFSGGQGLGKRAKKEGKRMGAGNDIGGGATPTQKPRTPRVLLSSYDNDPLNPGKKVDLDPRQGLIYQRVPDVKEGIYWINTSSPLAESIIESFGEKSQQWRSYLFQRYIDIFIKEEMRSLFKRNAEMFNPDYIDSAIFGEFMTKIYEIASHDLRAFLLEDRYNEDYL